MQETGPSALDSGTTFSSAVVLGCSEPSTPVFPEELPRSPGYHLRLLIAVLQGWDPARAPGTDQPSRMTPRRGTGTKGRGSCAGQSSAGCGVPSLGPGAGRTPWRPLRALFAPRVLPASGGRHGEDLPQMTSAVDAGNAAAAR